MAGTTLHVDQKIKKIAISQPYDFQLQKRRYSIQVVSFFFSKQIAMTPFSSSALNWEQKQGLKI